MYGDKIITLSNQVLEIPVTSVTVLSTGFVDTISVENGTLQMYVNIEPSNATYKNVTWIVSYNSPSGIPVATIDQNGLLTAVLNGVVLVTATLTQVVSGYPYLSGSKSITITNQNKVESITVTGENGATSITTQGGNLQMYATILPTTAQIKTVTWTVIDGTGSATITPAYGYLTAVSDGTVTVRATAIDGTGIYGELVITIENQTIPPTTKKLAPVGWHIPTDTEYTTLVNYLGGTTITGGKLKEIGYTHWDSPNTGASNTSGFTGFGSGYRGSEDGLFSDLKKIGRFWTSTAVDPLYADTATIGYNYASIDLSSWGSKRFGFPVRCVKDSTDWIEGETVTDIDGNTYPTIKIGNQVWMASNLKVTHYNDGTDVPLVEDDAEWGALTSGAMCWYDNIPE
jgi:uncharacterized protein (TIGR02145 family)